MQSTETKKRAVNNANKQFLEERFYVDHGGSFGKYLADCIIIITEAYSVIITYEVKVKVKVWWLLLQNNLNSSSIY